MNASLMPMPKQAFFATVNGVHGPIVGGYVYFYESGTTTPKDAYTTAAGSTPTANPIRLNARGEPATGVFLGPGAYTVKLADANNAEVWTQDGVIASIPTELVFAGTYGAIGDGLVDDTDAMQNALNAAVGKVLLLGKNKTYGITAITIPSGVTIVSNGSVFRKLAASGSYAITVAGGSTIDNLTLSSPGSSSDLGIRITGGGFNIDRIKAYSDAVDSLFGLRIESTGGGAITDWRIGAVDLSNWKSQLQVFNVDRFYLGLVKINSYITGAYIRDGKNGILDGAAIAGISPTSTGGPGENGLLIEATTTDATENLVFNGWHVKDSPEHGIRLGGQRRMRNIWFYGGSTLNTGAGGAGATGGSGFKVLGAYTTGEYHENINVDDFTIEDCSTTGTGAGNFAGLQIGMVKHGRFAFKVRKRNNPYSCWHGVTVLSSENIDLYPDVTSCRQHAAKLLTAGVTVPPYPLSMKDVVIRGGTLDVDSTSSNAVVFEPDDNTFTNVSIADGCLITGGVSGTEHLPPTTGAYVNCMADIVRLRAQVTTGNPPTKNSNEILIRMIGPLYGTFHAQGLDGSIITDPTTATIEQKVGGSWYLQGERYGTWTPTFTLVTNVDAATAVGVWRWIRIGDIVQFSGSVNIDNTTASAASELGISLPAAATSNFASAADAGGTAVATSPSSLCGGVGADPTNDRLRINWQAVSTTDNRTWYCTGSYQVK